jgi:hypothetical protein
MTRLVAMLNNLADTMACKCEAIDVPKIDKLRSWVKLLQRRNTPKVHEATAKRKRDNKIVSRDFILEAVARNDLNARFELLARWASSFLHKVELTPSEALAAMLELPANITRAAITAQRNEPDLGGSGGEDFDLGEESEKKDDGSEMLEGEESEEAGASYASQVRGDEEFKFEVLDETQWASWSRRHPGAKPADLPSVFLALERFPKQFYDESLGMVLFSLQNTVKPGILCNLSLSLSLSFSFSLFPASSSLSLFVFFLTLFSLSPPFPQRGRSPF